jgi:predicted transcriptional regulator
MPNEADIGLLQGKLRSLVEWDVLQLFHHNPHTVEGAQQIATALGRDVASVETALTSMTSVGLLQAEEAQTRRLYRLTEDSTLRDEIERFIRACDDPAFRRQVIEQLVAQSAKR